MNSPAHGAVFMHVLVGTHASARRCPPARVLALFERD